ncbi:TniQ family protein [Acidovorax sp. PRC11]|uniref:TniQ family protein n=1 Tax=Acidovorax sp. PRC11 TaxID=2962592 RepID=UPI003857DAA0
MTSADVRPGPFEQELLTSWLARVAVHSGCEPLVLTGAIWPDWRIWTVDADRQVSPEHAQAAAIWFNLPAESVHACTLLAAGNRLHGSINLNGPMWPWITTQGNRNRLRRAGLPFCPKCLAGDVQPYYRLEWRFAWVVGCERHGVRLVDRCDRCHAISEPHRSTAATGDLAHCVECGFDLRRSKCEPVDVQALSFQRRASDIFGTGMAAWGGEEISRTEWFRRARSLLAKDLCQVDARSAAAMGNRQIGLWFELQGPMEREARLRVLAGLLDDEALLVVRSQGRRRAPRSAQSTKVKNRRAKSPRTYPLARERVREVWARWLRRSRLW